MDLEDGVSTGIAFRLTCKSVYQKFSIILSEVPSFPAFFRREIRTSEGRQIRFTYHDSTAWAKRGENQRKTMMNIDGEGVRMVMFARNPLSFPNTSLFSVHNYCIQSHPNIYDVCSGAMQLSLSQSRAPTIPY